MLKKILIGIVMLVGAVLIVAAFRPAEFEVQRSAVIQAPPDRIQGLVDDFHQWNLWFLAPFEARNIARFDFTPKDGATAVTWTMTGRQAYVGRVMGLFVSMDRMIGGDFERGLVQLKAAAES